jgi:phosphoribosylaminoimidazole carboxylase (NCAIR synthetase)
MISEGKDVAETTAGQEFQHDIMQQVERHRREMAELLEEIEQSRDASTLKELEEECQVLRARLVHWQTEARKLDGTSTELPPNTSIINHSPPRPSTSNHLPVIGATSDDWDRTDEEEEMGQVRELRVRQNIKNCFVGLLVLAIIYLVFGPTRARLET